MVIFDQNKYNLEIPPMFCKKSFDGSASICKTFSKKCQKCEIPCQSVSNKLEVFDLPTDTDVYGSLKVLIAKSILFKKLHIVPWTDGKDHWNNL